MRMRTIALQVRIPRQKYPRLPCLTGSSPSSKTTVLPSIGSTPKDSHSAVVIMALGAVLGIILLTIATFFLWRYGCCRYTRNQLHRRPHHPPRSEPPIDSMMPSPILIAHDRRAECAIAEQPPAVPAREVQDPPRPALEAPPPAYEVHVYPDHGKQEVDHIGGR